MDNELLIALLIMWTSTTLSLVVFLGMWMLDGAAFHPHSVDVENRHPSFLVVNSKTVCKKDCAVKSISAFVAPRGSSSSKHFTALSMTISIAGIFGTCRWFFIGDASGFEAMLSIMGFASMAIVAAFELDVEPARFLEDKQMITGWLIEKLGMRSKLKFKLNATNLEFREFLRNSPEIYFLYEEDRYIRSLPHTKHTQMWSYDAVFHMIGAITYMAALPAAIILNDMAEEKVAWITGLCFVLFSCMSYLTGNYVPIFPYFRCWILVWNPFLREPNFMLKLKRSIEAYELRTNTATTPTSSGAAETASSTAVAAESSIRKRKNKSIGAPISNNVAATAAGSSSSCNDHDPVVYNEIGDYLEAVDDGHVTTGNYHQHQYANKLKTIFPPIDRAEAAEVDRLALNTTLLKYARKSPRDYLHYLGYVLVMIELIAILTPCVAMGLQWVTALCDGPPVYAILDLLSELFNCVHSHGLQCSLDDARMTHCILRKQ